MPNVNDVYPSKWLRAGDLRGRSHQLTIQDVDTGIVGQGNDAKTQLILMFQGDWKPLGLNKTNAGAISQLYGDETDDWIGQAVVLFPTQVDFNGQRTDAIRVDVKGTQRVIQAAMKAAKPGKKTAQPVTQAEVDAAMAADDDADIPFSYEPGSQG